MTKAQKGMMHGGITIGAILLIVWLISSGGGPKELTFPARTPKPIPNPATIEGTVIFEGTVPANSPIGATPECRKLHGGQTKLDPVTLVRDGSVQGAFVYVKSGLDPQDYDWVRTEHVIANRQCLYEPRVSGVMIRQPVRFENRDNTTHNFHIYTGDGKHHHNESVPTVGGSFVLQFAEPGRYRLACDIHSWMLGWLWVMDHPVFATTGEDGSFRLGPLPDGEFEIETWHESLGTVSGRIKVAGGETGMLKLTLPGK